MFMEDSTLAKNLGKKSERCTYFEVWELNYFFKYHLCWAIKFFRILKALLTKRNALLTKKRNRGDNIKVYYKQNLRK